MIVHAITAVSLGVSVAAPVVPPLWVWPKDAYMAQYCVSITVFSSISHISIVAMWASRACWLYTVYWWLDRIGYAISHVLMILAHIAHSSHRSIPVVYIASLVLNDHGSIETSLACMILLNEVYTPRQMSIWCIYRVDSSHGHTGYVSYSRWYSRCYRLCYDLVKTSVQLCLLYTVSIDMSALA